MWIWLCLPVTYRGMLPVFQYVKYALCSAGKKAMGIKSSSFILHTIDGTSCI